MTRAETLKAAAQCVTQDREQTYGSPEDNFDTIAHFWMIFLNRRCAAGNEEIIITPDDVAIMMALLKIARIATGEPKADNYIDLAGYAACAAEIATRGMKPEAAKVIDDELFDKLASEYLNVCDRQCHGDNSVGLQPCTFYNAPDVGAFGEPLACGCELSEYDRKEAQP